MKSLYFTTPTRPVGEKPPSKSMRQKASNPYISFAPFPALLPLFWHFSARPKLLVLGEALTQNFKKILRTNLRKQTWGARREESPGPRRGRGRAGPSEREPSLGGPHPREPSIPGPLAHLGGALAGRRGPEGRVRREGRFSAPAGLGSAPEPRGCPPGRARRRPALPAMCAPARACERAAPVAARAAPGHIWFQASPWRLPRRRPAAQTHRR